MKRIIIGVYDLIKVENTAIHIGQTQECTMTAPSITVLYKDTELLHLPCIQYGNDVLAIIDVEKKSECWRFTTISPGFRQTIMYFTASCKNIQAVPG